jgi:DNA-binding transcriptional MerR regulator
VSSALPASASLSIGEVLSLLRVDFPDITISKIRFLEAEGLIEPERSPSGYRKFAPVDVDRLRYVLSVQRDHYLPLRVIKERLEALGRDPEALAPRSVDSPTASAPRADAGPPLVLETCASDVTEVRLTREELMGAAGMDADGLAELEEYGLIGPRFGTNSFDGDALLIARTVRELSAYGLEPRHLRSLKAAAEREVDLVKQVVAPLRRQRNPQARTQAEQAVHELAGLLVRLHAVMVRAALYR